MTEPIHFQVTQLDKTVIVWAGKTDGKLGDLSVAMPPFGSQTHAPATSIFSKDVSEQSRNLSRRLASKYKQQFYVSLDLSSSDDMLFVFVEKKLTEMLKKLLA
ncbi:uncharacterized protein B0P05DRAFT_551485 [Gilbertella persicaria]|uniref:uncharacterized protein n=1 Tax=Gilbertella persicaria TaxID=101096 RepID=UPI00221E79F3|nr:uncharacterized protein B0P05DRAFT_551485 [Gilbertella persicaria]KAI8069075.1 hypothetical protein B0P05DRAFT_551485 [Gilbertella persicaria]